MGFELDTQGKRKQHVHLSDFQTKIWLKSILTSKQIFRLLVNNFSTRSSSESRLRWACCCNFFGDLLQTACQSDQY